MGMRFPIPTWSIVYSGDVVYIRCALAYEPLVPRRTRGPGCAPTIDVLRYETVQDHTWPISTAKAACGIWVVTRWEMIEPAVQAAPRVVEAEIDGVPGSLPPGTDRR